MTPVNPFPPGVDERNRALEDTARYVVPLSKFQRPRLYVIGGGQFEFPIGTEGMRLTGAATLAEHKYISDNAAIVQVTHRDAATIELTGTFPGLTGSENVRALRQMLVQVDPPDGKRLELPGILTQAQRVVADTWEFSRVEDSKWDFTYTVAFRIVGVTSPSRVTPPSTATPAGPKGDPKGKTTQQYTVKKGVQTLRQVSNQVYGSADRWKELYELNKPALSKMFSNAQIAQMPTKVLPLGTKLKYAK